MPNEWYEQTKKEEKNMLLNSKAFKCTCDLSSFGISVYKDAWHENSRF